MFWLLIICIALAYKWIFCFLLYVSITPYMLSQKYPSSMFWKVLGFNGHVVEHFLRGGGNRYLLFQLSLIPSIRLRRFLYRGMGAAIGKNAVLHFKTEIREPIKLKIGSGSIIGDNALLDAREGLVIGDNVNLSSNVSIYTLQHDHRDPYFGSPKGRKLSVCIGDRAWLGSNVIVLPGVSIGEGSVCCAGCVITKDTPPYSIVAGIPAKVIGMRNTDLRYVFDGKCCRLY